MLSGPPDDRQPTLALLGTGSKQLRTEVGVGGCPRGSKMREGTSLTTYSKRFLRAHRPNPTQCRNDGDNNDKDDKPGHHVLSTYVRGTVLNALYTPLLAQSPRCAFNR